MKTNVPVDIFFWALTSFSSSVSVGSMMSTLDLKKDAGIQFKVGFTVFDDLGSKRLLVLMNRVFE
jgi:hypothetical protein